MGKRRYHTDHAGKRFLIVTINGVDGIAVRWSEGCGNCGYRGEGHGILSKGPGCRECGYTGRRRRDEWVPIQETAPAPGGEGGGA